MKINFIFFKKVDWALVVALLLLIGVGLAAIYSVALGQGKGEFLNFRKQVAWLILGMVFLLALSNFNYRYWLKLGWVGYLIALIFLILVLTPLGATIRGTRGWFSFANMTFQPVEMMKFFLVIVLADVYSRYGRTIHKFGQLVLVSLAAFLPVVLVALQPDFGSATILFFLWFISFILITKNKKHIFIILGGILVALVISWFFIFADYQKSRLVTFVSPSSDPLGSGYNVQQSLIAVGAGKFFGRGLGFGSQSQLKFIPESQTDFIFAVIAEELGFVGVGLLLALFGFIFYRLYRIASGAPDDFAMFLAFLVLILIFIQVFINIGMSVGFLPVTGISLPFVSYGGSFLISALSLIGICLNVYRAGLTARKY
ncbi:MAG: FtsW/RodA/SpoVE family cell cycle protein [Patescibacteria group bacterium]